VHLEPRWSQDSAAIVYFTPPAEGVAQGALWEVSALGGAPRLLVSSISGGDVSHDGKRLTFFHLNGKQIELVVADCDGSNPRVLMQAVTTFSYRQPRWSPDDSSIAYLHSLENWSDDLYIISLVGGPPRQLTKETTLMSGLAWSPDASHLVYSTARGSTLLYLPTLHLWQISKSGGEPRQPVDDRPLNTTADHVLNLAMHLGGVIGTIADIDVARFSDPSDKVCVDLGRRTRIQQRANRQLAHVRSTGIAARLLDEGTRRAGIVSGLCGQGCGWRNRGRAGRLRCCLASTPAAAGCKNREGRSDSHKEVRSAGMDGAAH